MAPIDKSAIILSTGFEKYLGGHATCQRWIADAQHDAAQQMFDLRSGARCPVLINLDNCDLSKQERCVKGKAHTISCLEKLSSNVLIFRVQKGAAHVFFLRVSVIQHSAKCVLKVYNRTQHDPMHPLANQEPSA
eukprot:2972871-Rhodomonas_salina.1